jgi:predicted DNA-binding protein YlxM (UPF0122 family)
MTVYNLFQSYKPIIEVMRNNGFQYLPDTKEILAYEAYLQLISENAKREYIYSVLQEKYGVSKSTMLRLIKKMSKVAKL